MNDPIYLLSRAEYERYKPNIPPITCYWWLRSHGDGSRSAEYVDSSGLVCDYGGNVVIKYAVRPAISLVTTGLTIGQRVVLHDFPWIVIGEGVAIAEVPIAFRRFDAESNNYENSEVRKFLLDWWWDRK